MSNFSSLSIMGIEKMRYILSFGNQRNSPMVSGKNHVNSYIYVKKANKSKEYVFQNPIIFVWIFFTTSMMLQSTLTLEYEKLN